MKGDSVSATLYLGHLYGKNDFTFRKRATSGQNLLWCAASLCETQFRLDYSITLYACDTCVSHQVIRMYRAALFSRVILHSPDGVREK